MPHPTPILQDSSYINMRIPKTIGKTKQNKRTKEVKGKTCKKQWENQNKQTKTNFQTYVAQTGHRSKNCCCFFFGGGVSLSFLQVVPLTSLVLLVLLVFHMVVDILNRVHWQARSETDPSPHLLVAPSTCSNEGPAHKPTRWAKLTPRSEYLYCIWDMWASKLKMLHVGYTHVTYVYDVSRGKAGNRRGQSSTMTPSPNCSHRRIVLFIVFRLVETRVVVYGFPNNSTCHNITHVSV